MNKIAPVAILAAIAAGMYLLMNRKKHTPRATNSNSESTHTTIVTTNYEPTVQETRRNQLMEQTRNSDYRPPPAGTELTLAQEEELLRFIFAFEGVHWGPVKALTPNSIFDDLAFENILRTLEEALGLFPSTLSPRPFEAALMLMVENRELLVARTGVLEQVLKEQAQ